MIRDIVKQFPRRYTIFVFYSTCMNKFSKIFLKGVLFDSPLPPECINGLHNGSPTYAACAAARTKNFTFSSSWHDSHQTRIKTKCLDICEGGTGLGYPLDVMCFIRPEAKREIHLKKLNLSFSPITQLQRLSDSCLNRKSYLAKKCL